MVLERLCEVDGLRVVTMYLAVMAKSGFVKKKIDGAANDDCVVVLG